MAVGRGLSRGRHHAVSPFFAFQDIITSAIAILITIVLLLAVSVGDSGVAGVDTAVEQLRAQLALALSELQRAEADLITARDLAETELRDPAVMKAKAAALRNDLAALQASAERQKTQLAEIRRNDSTAAVAAELAKKRNVASGLAAEIDRNKREAEVRNAEAAKLESAAKEGEAHRLAEAGRTNDLWLIPESTAGSKEPVLAVVREKQVTLQRFNEPDAAAAGATTVAEFKKELRKYSALNQYIVFYFKPSGAAFFQELTSAARSAGFEIGYDAIGEDVNLHFGSAQ